MNTIIRVIQSKLSVIIWSRVAALHGCHCRAVNASVITAPANMAHSQKRLSSIRGEGCLFDFISACKTHHCFSQRTFPQIIFYILYFTSLFLHEVKGKKTPARNPSSVFFFFTAPTVYLLHLLSLSLLIFFMHCPRGIFFCLARLQFQQLCCAPGVARG